MSESEVGKDFEAARTEVLLCAASLLLAEDAPLRAVQVLHQDITRRLGQHDTLSPAQPYASRRDAEERHRRLLVEVGGKQAPASALSWLQGLRRRLPLWVSWATVIATAGGLTLGYSYAVLNRVAWQRDYPAGHWLSRYYSKPKFQGSPLVRYDVGVSHDWGKGAPAPSMARDHWSAKWDTCVVANSEVELKLRLAADDKGKVLLDGVVQLEVRKPGAKKARVKLRRGVQRLQVEFQEGRSGAELRLDGLDFAGNNSYHFRRPLLEGDDVRCESVAL